MMSELINYASAVLIGLPEAIQNEPDTRFSTQWWVDEDGLHETRTYQPVPANASDWLRKEAERIAYGTCGNIKMVPVGNNLLVREDVLAAAKPEVRPDGKVVINIHLGGCAWVSARVH